jgi:uncharacterized protein involved in exopolysaccharide biosynthesis
MIAMSSASSTETTGDRRRDQRPKAAHMIASGYGLRDLLNTIFREKRLIFSVFLLTFAAGASIALRMKPIYTAQARMLVLPSREYTLNPEVGEFASSFGLGEERMIRSETEILKNATLVDAVIETLGIERLYPEMGRQSLFGSLTAPVTTKIGSWLSRAHPPASGVAGADDPLPVDDHRKRLHQAAAGFTANLDISVVKDSSVIGLTFSHPQADVAVAALNSLILEYLKFRTQVLLLPRSRMFIEQRDGFARRLDQIDQDIAAFKLKYNISEFADQRSLLLRQHAEINSNKMDTETRLHEIEGRLASLREQRATLPKQTPLYSDNMAQDSAGNTRAILASLEARRNELLTKFTPQSQFISDINEQITKLRESVATTPPLKSDSRRLGVNPVYEEINTDRLRQESAAAALRAKRASLDEQFVALTAQLTTFDQLEKEFNNLTLNREILEKNLRIYAQKVEESLLQEEIDRQKTANVRIIEEPYTGQPRSIKFAVLVFSLIGAGIIAILLAFFKDFSRQVFVSPEDVERTLGLPVLVAISLNDRLNKSGGKFGSEK